MIWVATISGIVVLTACDTGDGKQLQPFDPADYPSQTVPPSVEDEFSIDPSVDFDIDPELTTAPTLASIESFAVTAPWLDGGTIDARFTCDGLGVSPALSWGGVPDGTVEIALTLVDDSTVSDGQPFVHWAIAGLDPAEIALAEGDAPLGSLQATNSFGDVGYGGPCPRPGDEPHLYRLTAYALNQQLELADGDGVSEFLDTIAILSIASTDVSGLYQR